jgi:hypothetical protein
MRKRYVPWLTTALGQYESVQVHGVNGSPVANEASHHRIGCRVELHNITVETSLGGPNGARSTRHMRERLTLLQ